MRRRTAARTASWPARTGRPCWEKSAAIAYTIWSISRAVELDADKLVDLLIPDRHQPLASGCPVAACPIAFAVLRTKRAERNDRPMESGGSSPRRVGRDDQPEQQPGREGRRTGRVSRPESRRPTGSHPAVRPTAARPGCGGGRSPQVRAWNGSGRGAFAPPPNAREGHRSVRVQTRGTSSTSRRDRLATLAGDPAILHRTDPPRRR